MNIGLVRHFKVNCDVSFLMTANEFIEWVKKYDNSNVVENEFTSENIKWDKCFSSDLRRATRTSERIFSGDIIKTQLLREVPIAPICKTNLKLPYIFWCISGRVAWFLQHKSQVEKKRDTLKRVNKFLDVIQEESNINILVVCHGFLISILQKEIKKRGFEGQKVRRPKNGRLYLFAK